MDYVHRTLRFDLVVWIGNMDDSRRRELYRTARLTLDDLAFLVIEPPAVNYPSGGTGGDANGMDSLMDRA